MSKSPVPAEGSFHFQTKTGIYNYVKKTGYLVKSPSNSRIGRWRKRWFMLVDLVEPGILTGTPERQIRLEYYNVAPLKMRNLRELPKRKGMIDLRPCIAIVANEDKIKGYKNIINIVMSSFRVHHLVAESVEDRDEWVMALNEFVFSKAREGQNYFTRTRVKQSVYTDFLTSSYYFRSKDDQFLSSHAMKDGAAAAALHQNNTGSDGECPPPIKEPRVPCGGMGSLQRSQSHCQTLGEGMEDIRRKSMRARKNSVHENPEETGGLLQIQLSNWNMTMITRSAIQFGETITSNCLKKTSHGTWASSTGTKQQVIVKTALKDPTLIMKEGLTIWQMMHPNIVMLLGAVLIDHPKHIVLEYCEKGTLLDVLHEQGRLLDSGTIKSSKLKSSLLKYCKQISLGLSYLKDKEIVHGAIKASNILVSNEDTCKISGFGESLSLKDVSYHQLIPEFEVPLEWTAPEAYSCKAYTIASDIWSLGIVLYEIWSLGCQPYLGMPKEEIIPRLKESYRLPPPPGVSKDIYRLMIELWHPNPEKRPKIESLVTFLVQPEGDLLHMNQLPKKSSQKVHSAHTLGAPINSGEILYRDLQLTYFDFTEESGEVKSPTFTDTMNRRDSKDSCSYIDINEVIPPPITRVATTKGNLKKDEKTLFWNDPHWGKSVGPPCNGGASSSQPSSPDPDPKVDDEADIYWNDPCLPPLPANTCTEETSDKDDGGSASHKTSFEPLLHKVNTQALTKLWNASNMSSSEEDESQSLAVKVKKKRPSNKRRACVNGSHSRSTKNSPDSDSNVCSWNICDSDNRSEKSPCLKNRTRCSSIPVIHTDERERATGYYNASALEVMEELSRSIEALIGPSRNPSSSSTKAKLSDIPSRAQDVTYTNLEEMKADLHHGSSSNEDSTNYYNSSATTALEIPSSAARNLESRVRGGTDYYNSSATAISLPASQEEGNRSEGEYYNSKAMTPAGREYYNSSTLSLEASSLPADVTGENTEPPHGYYNSSAVEIFGGSLGRNPKQHLESKSERSKSNVVKYVNLEFFDTDEETPQSSSENSNSQNPDNQEAPAPQFDTPTYCNLLDSTSLPKCADDSDDKNYELEESCVREDIRELLRVRSQKLNSHPPVTNKIADNPFGTYYNLTTSASRETNSPDIPMQPQAIVHVTPPYSVGSKKQKKPAPPIKYVHRDESKNKTHSKRNAQKQSSKEQLPKENHSSSPSRQKRYSHSVQGVESSKYNDTSCQPESSALTSSVVADDGVTHTSKGERAAGKQSDMDKQKAVPKKKPTQTGYRHNQNSMKASHQNKSPKGSPKISPSASPSFSPSRRNEGAFNSTSQTAYGKDSHEDEMETVASGDWSRSTNTKVQAGYSKSEHIISDTVRHSVEIKDQKGVPEVDKKAEKPFAIEQVKRMTSEPKDASRSAIKDTLSKVLSNPHASPSTKKRPSPPPKSAAVISAALKGPPPVAKKPMMHGSSSMASLLGNTTTATSGNISSSTSDLINGDSNTDGSPVSNHSPVTKAINQHKMLHHSSSETSTLWQKKQTKKPLLPPPSRGGSSYSKDTASAGCVKSRCT